MRPVILESPYKGNNYETTEENIRFARLCMHDCLLRGEAPFASHLLYTQEGVLDDKIPKERTLGIEAGFAWKDVADATVVYVNRGISKGMHLGIRRTIVRGQPIEYRSLPAYEKLAQPVIVTITGASGVGKTSIIKRFLEVRPCARLIQSTTSRSARPSDLDGEYEYGVAVNDFEKHKDDFLWMATAHGNHYATRRKSVSEIWLRRESFCPGCMILVPHVLPLLRNYLVDCDRLVSFYVLSPSEEELRRRLTVRGDDEATIQRRIDDCKKWGAEALRADIPYVFLSNNESDVGIEMAVEQMCVFL
ncbi:MAG: hypothetical protein AAB611_00550 [Patescibacteria group bacterium]